MLIGEVLQFKQNQKAFASVVAYLIGVKRDNLYILFEDDIKELKELDNNKNARVLRSLCKIRSKLMNSYIRTENAIVYDMKNLNTQDDYKDDIKKLEDLDVHIIKSNCRVNKYIVSINDLIRKYVDLCRDLVPEWVEWIFIKNLFIMPNGNKEELIREESDKYNSHKSNYPYGLYINWKPVEEGNILLHDKKFLRVIYEQNGRYFDDNRKVYDANNSVKSDIYSFIDNNETTVIVVDCENSDPYKLYSVLKNLNKDEIAKINKIILYDDVHTTNAWKNFDKFVDIPVEYILIERLKDEKSLVDLRMCSGISANYYRDKINAFIIVSSDSDYWAIISAIPEAKYLVMIESSKSGEHIKKALESRGIFYCYIDDFCSGNISEFKNLILTQELDKRLMNLIDANALTLLESVYSACRLDATEVEKKNFFDKNIKKLKLQIDSENEFHIVRS